MKIGSLFDGSGGFPLAASMCGIEPVWAAEVEPYPIAVTRSRFPNMKHLGSVTEVNGAEVEPVDIISFGAPCQDLSVAGKRAGLRHEGLGDEETTRSGLFMEAVRIIKEMREATNGEYPRYAIYENVPGAFSSSKGEDFRIVLEELIKVVEPTAVMPEVPKSGWPYSDVYCGDGWSLAYRVLDAQYWGVPQRRRRIYLVADFRGQRAGKVSFERKGLRGYFAESGTPREAVAGDAESGAGTANRGGVPYTLKIRTGVSVDSAGKAAGKGALIQTNKAATLAVSQDQYLFQPVCSSGDVAGTLDASYFKGCGMRQGVEREYVVEPIIDDQGGSQITVRYDGKSPTLRAEMHGNVPCVMEAAGFKAGQSMAGGIGWQEECAATLSAQCSGTEPTVVYSIENHPADSRVNIDDSGKVQTLTSRMGTGGGNVPMVMESIPIHDQATRFSGKRGDKSDGKGNGLGVGEPGDPMNTLTSGDRHAVAYWDGGQVCGTLTANNAGGNQRMPDKDNFNCVIEATPDVAGVDCRNATEYPEMTGTLQAKSNGGFSLNCNQIVRVRYIVRRLTPTECARLQGFPDKWGHPDVKTELTDEEYSFWLNVRNTHASINGKATREYTREQMLTWYNKLHTDSAEYKLWGNGIALPCALYVMEGIADEPRN